MYIKRNVPAYAVALYDLIKEQDKFEYIQPQIEAAKDILMLHPEYVKYFGNDLIPIEERFETLDLAFKNFDIIVLNALKVIIQRRMASYIVAILIEYLKLSNSELKIRFLIVQSAFKLTKAQMQAIQSKMQKVTRRTVVLKNEIDPSLISGIKIVSKTEVIEMNILNNLNKIKNELINLNKKEVK